MRRTPIHIALPPLCAALLGCATSHANEPVWYPVPDVTRDTSFAVRGNASAAGALSNEDQTEIVSRVLRTFYYPPDRQSRWLDPRPLAHVRTQAADDTAGTDLDFADEVVAATRVSRICVLGGRDTICRGKPGGVVRFSWPYRVGRDSAVVFATYSPRDSLGKTAAPQSEMQFRMVRGSDDYWEMKGKSTVTGPSGSQPAASSTPPPPES